MQRRKVACSATRHRSKVLPVPRIFADFDRTQPDFSSGHSKTRKAQDSTSLRPRQQKKWHPKQYVHDTALLLAQSRRGIMA